MNPKTSGISILICTHNGQKNLPETLKHVAAQKVSADLQWEVMLVNNASIDDTVATALKIWDEYKSIPLVIIDEKKPGKDKAVDAGLYNAKYRYVIICDDDNWLNDDYVQTAYTIMEQDPAIGILGGKGVPEFEVEPPDWFFNYQVYYAIGDQHIVSGNVKHYWPKYNFIWGA